MKKLFLSFFVLAFIFTFNKTALADGGHSVDSNVKQATDNFRNGTNNDQQEHSNDGDTHYESGDVYGKGTSTSGHLETENHNDGSGQDENHSDTEGGHHGPVVETPPNYKVLGSYGAVNLLFILIGVWNKWFRRKGK